jgi:hypothetical protein
MMAVMETRARRSRVRFRFLARDPRSTLPAADLTSQRIRRQRFL